MGNSCLEKNIPINLYIDKIQQKLVSLTFNTWLVSRIRLKMTSDHSRKRCWCNLVLTKYLRVSKIGVSNKTKIFGNKIKEKKKPKSVPKNTKMA